MFTTLIVQPIFNLLILIMALIPSHNFGAAIIIFTALIRLLLWPLVKKQLHHARAIRELQPDIKKIKAATKGDRQKESQLTMELYKERQINPFSSLGIVLAQAPILIGLYLGLQKVIKDPQAIVTFSYSWLHNLPWMQSVTQDIHNFDSTLFGVVDLTRSVLGPKGFYFPALILVASAAAVQFFQSKQLMPQSEDSRGLRAILRDAGKGKSADQSEVNAAVGRGTIFLIPAFVFLLGLHLAAALPLYWLVSSSIAFFQQTRILNQDVKEAEATVDSSASTEVETLDKSQVKKAKQKKRSKTTKSRRKRK